MVRHFNRAARKVPGKRKAKRARQALAKLNPFKAKNAVALEKSAKEFDRRMGKAARLVPSTIQQFRETVTGLTDFLVMVPKEQIVKKADEALSSPKGKRLVEGHLHDVNLALKAVGEKSITLQDVFDYAVFRATERKRRMK